MADVDRATVAERLRAAVEDSGLSQAGFARALGTSASRLSTYLRGGTVPSAAWYLRALRVGGSLSAARDRSWLTPVQAAEAVRVALEAGDQVWGLRLILQSRDHLRSALDDAEGCWAAWEAAPGPVGAKQWDRLLEGVIGHEFECRGRPAPAWTASTADEPWLFASPFFTEAEVRAATPDWMVQRGMFIAARDLVTA